MNAPPTIQRPLVEVNAIGLRALVEALGPADTARFLSHYGPGRGDYTAERDTSLGGASFDDVLTWVRETAAAKR